METTKFEQIDACTFKCETCEHEFEYSNPDSPDDDPPNFCPMCGRSKAA